MTTICVEIEGTPIVVTPPLRPGNDGVLTLNAMDATVHGGTAKIEGSGANANVGYWTDATDFVSWVFELPGKGDYDVVLEYASPEAANNAKAAFELDGGPGPARVEYALPSTGSWRDYKRVVVGRFGVPAGGKYTLTVRPAEMKNGFLMNLRRIELRPRV
jgi:hypothetical protein